MARESEELAWAWLQKAEGDLQSANILIHGEAKHLDTGVYHCQQVGEKALKAWLTVKETPFPKTHDLEILLHLCKKMNVDFRDLSEDALLLTPFATEFRYPGDVWEPELEDAENAYCSAERFVNFIKTRLKKRKK